MFLWNSVIDATYSWSKGTDSCSPSIRTVARHVAQLSSPSQQIDELSPLEALPVEILSEMADDFFTLEDLKNIRLTSKHLAHSTWRAFGRHGFSTRTVVLHPYSLRQGIPDCFKQFVTKIRVMMVCFEYEERHRSLPYADRSALIPRIGIEHLRGVQKSRHKFDHEALSRLVFEMVQTVSSSLQTIELSSNPTYMPLLLKKVGPPCDSPEIWTGFTSFHLHEDALSVVLRALSWWQKPLRALDVSTLIPGLPILALLPATTSFSESVLSGLKCLQISQHYYCPEYCSDLDRFDKLKYSIRRQKGMLDVVAQTLSQATGLEEFVYCSRMSTSSYGPNGFYHEYLFDKLTFGAMRSLHLCSLRMTPRSLETFLVRHKSTLTKIHLEGFSCPFRMSGLLSFADYRRAKVSNVWF